MSNSYDPWQTAKTKNGYYADEVISALQKTIRRAMEEEAAMFAYELTITSPELEEKMWKRLMVISVEDVGLGSPQASALVHHLYEMHLLYHYGEPDRTMFAIHAVRVLCQSPKDRSSDMLLNICMKNVEHGNLPEIPEVALDMHTRRGQEMKRDIHHFLTEASQVFPQADIDQPYKERYLHLLKKD